MIGDSFFGPIDLRNLRVDSHLACDLYIEEGKRYVLYREASLPFTLGDRERLMANGTVALWVKTPTGTDSSGMPHLPMLLSLTDEEMPPLAKARLVYNSAISITHQAIGGSISPETVENLDHLMSATVSYLVHSQTAFPALLSMMFHDFSVFTHAANVAIYAIGLGKFVGITDSRGLRNLGLAAFLHDAGKSRVPKHILCKKGPLTSEEWSVMHQHPAWGAAMLSRSRDLPEIVSAVVAQHHERLDGSGYPYGIGGKDLPRAAMIVALVDAYDAMTSERSYRGAYSPYQALACLKREMVGKLDSDLFASLVLLLGNPSQACES